MNYDANNDEELRREMFRARCLLQEFNALSFHQEKERERLIHSIVDMKEGGCIISPFYCDYGYHICSVSYEYFICLEISAETDVCYEDGAWHHFGNRL